MGFKHKSGEDENVLSSNIEDEDSKDMIHTLKTQGPLSKFKFHVFKKLGTKENHNRENTRKELKSVRKKMDTCWHDRRIWP